jgi:hypothetical protein
LAQVLVNEPSIPKAISTLRGIREKYIKQETYCVAGQNKGVSKPPIHLKICTPDVMIYFSIIFRYFHIEN